MWLTESFIYHSSGANSKHAAPRGVGYGIGLAVALFGMQGGACINSSDRNSIRRLWSRRDGKLST